MKQVVIILSILCIWTTAYSNSLPSGKDILKKVDENQLLDHAIMTIKIVIHGRSGTRTMTLKSWVNGKDEAFSEYLSPAREKGKKMLKLSNKLWTYSPEPHDRIITISGHLLKQSVFGSDLSYEDYMGNSSMIEDYKAQVIGRKTIEGRSCFVLELTAKRKDVPYARQKIWVDSIRWVVLKADLMAKSGKTVKRTMIKEVMQVENRWYPKQVHFKDILSKGNGTEYHVEDIDITTKIPKQKFTKAALRR